MKKAFVAAGLFLLLLLPGCRPEGIIPPEEMSSLFAAFYQADASVELAQEMTTGEHLHYDSIRVYRPILEEHGYTEEMFRASLNYYLHNPAKLVKICDRACDWLENEADKEIDEEEMEKEEDTALAETGTGEGTEPAIEEPAAPSDSTVAADSTAAPEKKAPRRTKRKKMTRQELKQLEKDLK